MIDKINNLIRPNHSNSYCNDTEEDSDKEVKSTNCYYYSTEEFTKVKFKPSTSFYISLKYSFNTTPY